MGGRGDRQHLADRLDPMHIPMHVDERHLTSTGGRTPPSQNKLTLCEESHLPDAVRGSHAPAPSSSQRCLSECRHAGRHSPGPSSPDRSASEARNRSSPKSTSLSASVSHAGPHCRKPSAQHVRPLQGKTCSSCCSGCSILLRSWSLQQTRSGSGRSSSCPRSGVVVRAGSASFCRLDP